MIPHFTTKEERLLWAKENKHLLIQAKKTSIKHADSVSGVNILGAAKMEGVVKELGSAAAPDNGVISVKSVINTTNYFDSHMDVHIPGLWKKSLSETPSFYLLKEHKMSFESVIADEVKAFTKSISWKSLGYDYDGNTQALVFDAAIKQARNAFMFEQYASGYVKNHSVGMRYIKILMCVNSEEKWWIEEKENWDKYYNDIINKDDADEYGMFWAVTEAKVNEGSAVLFGSNPITPTISVTEAGKATSEIIEPDNTTQGQPRKSRFASIGSKIN